MVGIGAKFVKAFSKSEIPLEIHEFRPSATQRLDGPLTVRAGLFAGSSAQTH
jgi:hypothetical protein